MAWARLLHGRIPILIHNNTINIKLSPLKILRNHILSPSLVFIPNRTFLVRFGGISGEFDRAMVCILARRNKLFTVPKFGLFFTRRPLSSSKNVSRVPIVDVDVWLFMVWKWTENELFMVRISTCTLSFLLWRILQKIRRMLWFLDCFEDDFWDNRE